MMLIKWLEIYLHRHLIAPLVEHHHPSILDLIKLLDSVAQHFAVLVAFRPILCYLLVENRFQVEVHREWKA